MRGRKVKREDTIRKNERSNIRIHKANISLKVRCKAQKDRESSAKKIKLSCSSKSGY